MVVILLAEVLRRHVRLQCFLVVGGDSSKTFREQVSLGITANSKTIRDIIIPSQIIEYKAHTWIRVVE